jgi:hypothetical protein
MARHRGKLSIVFGVVAAGWLGGQPVEAKTVDVSPLADWYVLPSLMGGNGEIIVATGALFLPCRRVRSDAADYDDAARVEAGVALGGVHASAGVARVFNCPHAMDWCAAPYIAPEIFRAAWLTNWTHRTYVGLDLGANLVIFKVTVGALHAAEDYSSIYWQLRVGLGW